MTRLTKLFPIHHVFFISYPIDFWRILVFAFKRSVGHAHVFIFATVRTAHEQYLQTEHAKIIRRLYGVKTPVFPKLTRVNNGLIFCSNCCFQFGTNKASNRTKAYTAPFRANNIPKPNPIFALTTPIALAAKNIY